MKDRAKTKEQLLSELAELHQRIPELEALETKHKRIEKALLASAQQWQRTFDAIGDVVCLQGVEGRILRCNIAMANLLGKSLDEIKGRTCWELMHGTSEPIEGCPIVRMRETHHRETFIVPRGDRWLEDSVDPLLDENDNLIGTVHIISDITERRQAEEALQESERRFSDVAENALEWIWEVDANGKYTYASPAVEKILGYEPKEILNKHFYDLFHPEERDQLRQAALKVFAKKEPFREFMNRNVHKNGEIVWLSTSGAPILNQKGDLIGYRGADADITERKQTEQQLNTEREKLKGILSSIEDGLDIVSQDYRVYFQNKLLQGRFGDLTGKLCYEGYRGRSTPCTDCPMVRAIESDSTQSVEMSGIDGRDYEVRATPFVDIDGEVKAIEVIRDITERKQAEKELRESEERYRALVNLGGAVGEAIVMLQDTKQGDAIQIFVNREWPRITGYSRKELLGMSFFDLLHPRYRQAALKRHKRKVSGETIPGLFEMSVIRKDGTEVPIELTSAYTTYKGERANVAFIRDITERKQAEKALRESERNFRNSLDNSPLGIRIVTAEGDLLYANKAILDIYDYSSVEELKAVPTKQRYTSQSYAEHSERRKKRKLGKPIPSNYEISIVRKDGEIRHLAVFRREVIWNGEVQFQALYQDITKRKRAEEELRESEERYRALVNLGGAVGEAIVMLQDTEQGDAIQTFVNKEWPHITGYSEKELLGMSFFDLLHPRYHQAALKRHKRRMRGEVIPELFELSIIRKDGTELPIEATSAYSTYKGERANVVFIRDITERKQVEEVSKELQQELYLSSRLAAIGRLAAGVAHQINNPLTGILGFSERLLRKSTDKEATRDLGRIHSEAARTAKIVQNLLTFARRHKPEEEYSDINDILQKALELRAYELKTGNIEVALDLTPDLPQIMVDFHQIQEVFLNLILNAEQAMTEAHRGGKLTIKTQRMKDYIRISFADDGPGIPAKYLDKLFDPFFTTRGEKGGTGLGLSVCHGIVTEHEGTIYAQSKPRKGTTFFVELLVTTEKAEEDK